MNKIQFLENLISQNIRVINKLDMFRTNATSAEELEQIRKETKWNEERLSALIELKQEIEAWEEIKKWIEIKESRVEEDSYCCCITLKNDAIDESVSEEQCTSVNIIKKSFKKTYKYKREVRQIVCIGITVFMENGQKNKLEKWF